MSYNFKETMNKPERLAPGHRMCAGCGGTIAVRNVLRGLHEGDKAVIGNATGCLEVSTFTYPYTSWEDSYIHNAFENAGATLSGVEGAYKALKKKGKLKETYPLRRVCLFSYGEISPIVWAAIVTVHFVTGNGLPGHENPFREIRAAA